MIERLTRTSVPEFHGNGTVSIRTQYSLGSFALGRESGQTFHIFANVRRNIARELAHDLRSRYCIISYGSSEWRTAAEPCPW